MSDTPRTDELQEELAGADGPECVYTEEMADRMWILMRDLEGTLTRLYASVTGDSMALGIMQLQRDEIRTLKRELAEKAREVEEARKRQHMSDLNYDALEKRTKRAEDDLQTYKLQRQVDVSRIEQAEAEVAALREDAAIDAARKA